MSEPTAFDQFSQAQHMNVQTEYAFWDFLVNAGHDPEARTAEELARDWEAFEQGQEG